MHLYQGTSEQFIADAVQARLATQLSDRFFHEFRYKPPNSEVMSWQNSLGAMANVLQLADLRDQGIIVELKLPLSSKRLDVMITGTNPSTGDAAVIVELKQWTKVGRSNISECVTVEFGGGHEKDVLHPSKQVAQYQRYLMDTHPAFSDLAIELNACSYLHNAQYDPISPLYHSDFETLLALNPLFTGTSVSKLTGFLEEHVVGPDDGSILQKVAATAFKPHKRLLDFVARVIPPPVTKVPFDPPQTRTYRDGDRVRHPRWGDGIVISSRVTRSDEEVTIAFRDPEAGRKTLLASLAALERLAQT